MKKYEAPPPMTVGVDRTLTVTMRTSRGDIVLELYPQHAPVTVNNFLFLAGEGFYDGVAFHRVIPDFVIQGGDPTGTGSGGPGYRFEDEIVGNPLRHGTGALSMANAGPGTNGSQFFITRRPQSHLDGRHTVFGRVVSGQDVVEAIRQGDVIEGITMNDRDEKLSARDSVPVNVRVGDVLPDGTGYENGGILVRTPRSVIPVEQFYAPVPDVLTRPQYTYHRFQLMDEELVELVEIEVGELLDDEGPWLDHYFIMMFH